jgi:predicted AAA+ superfamily ATPase
MSPQSLLADWQTLGLVFENLCIRDLTVYARSLEYVAAVPVRYYRDDAGLEVDAVVELADGRWGAFEIKLSENKADDGLRSLRRLRKKLCENPAARTRPPEFLAVLVGIGRFAYQVEDGLYVIPVRTLGR